MSGMFGSAAAIKRVAGGDDLAKEMLTAYERYLRYLPSATRRQ